MSNASPAVPPSAGYAPPRRPSSVLAGCVACWIGGAFGVLLSITLIVASGREDFKDQVGVGPDDVAALRLFGIFSILWCGTVLALAVFAFHRRRWAAIALAAMLVVYAIFTLVMAATHGTGNGILGVLYSASAVAAIFSGSRSWYAAH